MSRAKSRACSLGGQDMADMMVRAVSKCGRFRAVAAVTTGVVEALRLRHNSTPVATAALGRAMTGAFLMGSELKAGQRLMIQILGSGPLGEVFAETTPDGSGRGYVRHPQVDLPGEGGKIQVGKAVGTNGTVTVLKDLGLKEPYRGVVPITSGEIGKDLAYYLTVSEQIPSAVALGVYVEPDLSVGAAGGYLVQTLPGATEEEIGMVEANIRTMPLPTELIRMGRDPQDILFLALKGYEVRFLGEQRLRFRCRCSRGRLVGILVALGPVEIEGMILEQGGVEVTCEFCRKTYRFSRQALEGLLQKALDKGP